MAENDGGCFLDGGPTLMEVTSISSFGVLNFNICERCYRSFGSDTEMAAAVMEKALRDSGCPLPVDISEVPKILRDRGLIKV